MLQQPARNEFFTTFFIVVIYAACFYGIQFFLYKIAIAQNIPTDDNLLHWDSGWYMSAVKNGCVYDPGCPSNSGFFMLFPLVWKMLGLTVWGVSFLNILFFAAGVGILSTFIKLSSADKILWLSIPSVYFAFIPYSEALFFLLGSISFAGILKGNRWMVWVSLFLLSLTRATAIVLMPAFLVMALVSSERRLWARSLGRYFVDYAFPMLLGLGVFVLYQFWQTGVWFAYFKQQSVFWARTFSWPELPFKNLYGANRITWISGLAVFVGLIALIFAISSFVKWLAKNVVQGNKLLLLSCGYLSTILLTNVFFNPRYGPGTAMDGIFRYTMMTPFFYIFIGHFTSRQYKWPHFLFVFLLATSVWLCFGAYVHIQYMLFFTTNTLIILLYMLYANKRLSWPALVITAINIFFQIHFFQQFIADNLPTD